MRRALAAILALAASTGALLAATEAHGQASPVSLAGTYDGRQMELAAALRLGVDGRFDYYLSYGALDETASGTWTVEGDAVVLDSDPVAAPGFALIESDKGRGGRFDLALEAPHGLPVQLFEATLILSDGTAQRGGFGEERLRFPLERGKTVAALQLDFPVFRVSSGRIEVPQGTRAMRFRFEPNDLGKVAFDHQVLPREQGALVLARYDRKIRFRKESGGAP
jgi:hypothetical protein